MRLYDAACVCVCLWAGGRNQQRNGGQEKGEKQWEKQERERENEKLVCDNGERVREGER